MLKSGDPEAYLHSVLATLGRILTFPAVTVAAVNGHAFGAGAQMAVAHDYRVMRADRGFFCMPEVDMKVPLHPAMTEILKAGLPTRTCREVIATGRRYGGSEAAAKGIVDRAVSEAELLPAAVEIAAGLAAKADPAMGRLKAGLVPQVLAVLDAPLPGAGG
jgi:enoyl-CoA hydratase/carnithine racemase